MPTAKEWEQTYGKYADEVSRYTSLHATDLLTFAIDVIQKASVIVDIPCGVGVFADAYMRLFPNGIKGQTLVLCDFNSSMVDRVRSVLKDRVGGDFQTDVKFQTEDAISMDSFTDSSVDVVTSVFGIFLVPDQQRMMATMRRILRPGGAIVTTSWADWPSAGSNVLAELTPTFVRMANFVLEKMIALHSSEKAVEFNPLADGYAWRDKDGIEALFKPAGFGSVTTRMAMHSVFYENSAHLWDVLVLSAPSRYQIAHISDDVRVLFDREFGGDNMPIVMASVSNIVLAVLDGK